MSIVFRGCGFLLAFCLLTGCQYLSDKTPTCSDDVTLDLARQIIGEMTLDGSPLPSSEALRNRLTFNYPHATKLEENIRKYSCEAHLIVVGESQKHKIELTYTSQLDDSGNHLVEVSGITVLDAAVVKAALSLAPPKANEPQKEQTPIELTPAVDLPETPEAPEATPQQIEKNRAERQAVLDGNGPTGQWPRFSEYAVSEIYNGPPAKLDMSGETAQTFKTRLREGLTEGEIDAAGEYTAVGWGCGAGCFYFTYVNKRTGQVVEDGIGGESGEKLAGMDRNSRLVITEGAELDDDYNELGYYAFFYELVDNKLNLIKKTPIQRSLEE